jgi:ABC-type antimicrobial peptide transport system permease subunit
VNSTSLTAWGFILASIRHYWQISVAVAIGVATATAVITGALLVGDSMRGSLADLTVERLGATETMVAPIGFFDVAGITVGDVRPIPLIFFSTGIAESSKETNVKKLGLDPLIRRAGSVQIIGVDESFWNLDSLGIRPEKFPDDTGVVINRSAADELAVHAGDRITIRLPADQAVPADSPLGRRDATSEGLPRMEVLAVIDDRGLGRFSLSPSQAAPQNIYVSRKVIGEVLDREDQANLLLFDRDIDPSYFNVDLDDLGLSLRRVKKQFEGKTVFDYYTLTSDRLLLPGIVVDEVIDELGSQNVAPVTTYLANAIERLDESGKVIASVPYSTITAIDSSDQLPLDFDLSSLSQAEDVNAGVIPMVINSWASKQLDADVGTRLRVAYYEPEVENGKEIERTFDAIVTGVVPITKPSRPYRRRRDAEFDQAPTVYNDPDLTPLVPGVTDQDSIGDWDLPFQLQREIDSDDDDYWNDYRLTPKAFLPLKAGRRLFGSRFGETTSLRIAATVAADVDALQNRISGRLHARLDDLGWSVIPIRRQQLAASRGTTPFDGLFLALSFFVIAAAVLLIAMLLRLGLTERTKQLGTMLAVGWTPARIRRVMMGEGVVISGIGAVLGVLGGWAYAWGVLWALRTAWVGAVTVPFMTFHYTISSLIIGAVAGWLTAVVTAWLTTRWLLTVNAQRLLSGGDVDVALATAGSSKLPAAAMVIAGFGLMSGILGSFGGGQAATGGFVGGGMLLMMAVLIMVFHRLRRRRQDQTFCEGYSVSRLAARNASRRPLRSTMTIGLMATASFLIIAISAFRLQPSERGTGGFELMAKSAQPIFIDLRDEKARQETFGRAASDLEGISIAAMRLRLGQDASCNNLYQATKPTVIGVPSDFGRTLSSEDSIAGFDWASYEDLQDGEMPWDRLSKPAAGTQSDPIPVVIDQNTAMWSLQMTGGIGQVKAFEYDPGKPIYFQVVGLLANSVLQGQLLIGETNFTKIFPDISGYQFFLFDVPPKSLDSVSSLLESRLSDVGMDVSRSRDVLAGMLAVQNTYLRTFQSLGALGLLLGTIGLAVAQVRSVIERQSELAVMRAIGFTGARLAWMVMLETASLLVVGIGCGLLCACLAVLPHAWFSNMRPPIGEPMLIVLGILVFGLCAGLFAIHRISRMPLIRSLRAE